MDGIDVAAGEVIKSIHNESGYAYLGILELLDPCHKEVKK